jgi:pyruvate dehydrogenase E2 component (dihydrolipoamide acetyltransferase)
MPSLGASMEEGTLVQWMKKPGDALKRGDIIAVVDTEKGAIEIEVFEDGVLEQLRVQPGQKVPVGTVLAVVAESDLAGVTARVSTAASAPVTPTVPATPPPAPPRVSPAAAPSRAPRRATPAARSLASHLGVDLATVQGTGEGGAITRADVERARAPAAAAAAPVPPADASTRMRQAIAAAMSQSKRDIPHFYLATTIDVSRALDWLAAENAARPVPERLLPAALLVKSVALAMRDEPDVNGFWIDGGFRAGPGVHPGIAISLRGGGLVAPAIHDADRKDLTTLMERLRRGLARALRRPSQLGAVGSDTDDHELRRTGRRGRVRHHLPAPGGAGCARQDRRATGRGRWPGRGAAGDHRDALGRPPRHRRPSSRPVPRRDRPSPPGAGAPMTTEEIRSTVVRLVTKIAPEARGRTIAPAAPLREELDLDSMDVLNFVIALHDEWHIDIPERDYAKLTTLDDTVSYVAGRLNPPPGG